MTLPFSPYLDKRPGTAPKAFMLLSHSVNKSLGNEIHKHIQRMRDELNTDALSPKQYAAARREVISAYSDAICEAYEPGIEISKSAPVVLRSGSLEAAIKSHAKTWGLAKGAREPSQMFNEQEADMWLAEYDKWCPNAQP